MSTTSPANQKLETMTTKKNKVHVHVTLDDLKIKLFKAAAEELGCTQASLIRDVIHEHLESTIEEKLEARASTHARLEAISRGDLKSESATADSELVNS